MRPALTSASARRRRRVPRLAAILGLALAISLLLAPAALANFLTPKSGGSPNADSIASLYKIILYLAIVVFVIVEGALVYSIYKFRAKKSPVAAQIHGNTRLEIGWTVAAAVILVVITVVTFVKLPSIINPPNTSANGLLSASLSRPNPPNGKSVTICVQGRQFIWRYVYGATCRNNAFNSKLPYSYHDDVRAGEHDRRPRHPVDRRHPLVVGPVARRQGRRRARATRPTRGSSRRRTRSSGGSARSCAAVTTPR